VSCLPAAIPFLIFSEPQVALRVSNFLLIASLYHVGQKWARYAGRNPLLIGSAMVAVGLGLVGVAILLEG
jgi:VIT1/CCC1 family predicted Fe2+/Mn2+ transporter